MILAEQLDMLKIMTGEADQNVLAAYLNLAGNKVIRRAYPFGTGQEFVPEEYTMVQVEIAAYLLNKRGAEGQTAHSENGVSRSYEDGDVPASMLRQIIPFAGVVGTEGG